MRLKQIEKTKKKIAYVKRILSAEKRKFGCIDDSQSLRYLPTKYFIQLGDYSGGQIYLMWFGKNFPDDRGFPEFLFERTVILFKTGKTKKAEQKAFQTFYSNPYWFHKYFDRSIFCLIFGAVQTRQLLLIQKHLNTPANRLNLLTSSNGSIHLFRPIT